MKAGGGLFAQVREFMGYAWGPQPMPSRRYPLAMPPSVAKIPLTDFVDLGLYVVSRLKLTSLVYQPVAYAYAKSHPELIPLTDSEFTRLFSESVFSRFLNARLDEPDKRGFKKQILSGKKYKKVDFTLMSRLFAFPGLFIAPTITLFGQDSKNGLEPVAIKINDLVLTPTNKSAWELAKFFVLQGANYHLVLGFHPWVHFPMDTIIAATKSILPKAHLIHRLLSPHMRFTLALNNRVLEHPRTIVENLQDESYSPYTAPGASIRSFMSAMFLGVDHNSSFPAYHYDNGPAKIDSLYGEFLNGYYQVILKFTRQISARVPKGDPDVARWADTISQWLPGFPDNKKIFLKDELARSIAHFIWDVSVVHAADHENYSAQPIGSLPFRLRIPPPSSVKTADLDLSRLCTPHDIFRHKMAHEMFFKPHNITLLHDTSYDFTDRNLKSLNNDFLNNLKEYDKNLKIPHYIALKKISRSIQY